MNRYLDHDKTVKKAENERIPTTRQKASEGNAKNQIKDAQTRGKRKRTACLSISRHTEF